MAAKTAIFPVKKDSGYWGRLAQAAVADEAAFTELYEHFFPRVYRHLLSKTKDSALADDLVSETFIRCLTHLRDFDPERGAFSTWLFRIALNVMNKHYGSKAYTSNQPWEEGFDPPMPDWEVPERKVLSKERSEELRAAIMKLPERQRKILEMTYWFEMKSNEVAAALGMAPSSVRVALKQARDKLREMLGDRGEDG